MSGVIRRAVKSRHTGYMREQRRQFLPLLLGGAATVCAVGFLGIAGIVVGDNLYRNWKEKQQLKQGPQQEEKASAPKSPDLPPAESGTKHPKAQ